MGTKNIASALSAVHPLRCFSPTSRKVALFPLVGCCLLFILSSLQWSMIDKSNDSSLDFPKAKTKIVVSAFRIEDSFRQPPRQHIFIPRRFPFSSPSIQQSALFFSNKDSDFTSLTNSRPHSARLHYRCIDKNDQVKKCYNPLFGANPDASDNDSETEGESGGSSDKDSNKDSKKKRLPSMKRVGGRSRRPKSDDAGVAKTSPSENQFPSGGSLVVGLLVLTLLKNLLFGGMSDSDNYYYYSYSSSSVYETRLNPDGSRTTTETSRKESSDLKTNIPGLTDKDFLDRSSSINRGGLFTDYFYFEE